LQKIKEGADKKMKNNPYQTNKGGEIKAPRNPSSGDPKATTIKSKGDLRSPKGK
jgi:hypothetical protein